MKRFILTLAAAALVPALALAQTSNPNAKVDPKNNKVSNPVVAKPKEVVLTRDQLRACMDEQDANDKEAEDVRAAQDEWKKDRDALMAEKDVLAKANDDLAARATAAKAEQVALLQLNTDIKNPKLDKDKAAAMIKDYNARAAAFSPRVDAIHADDAAFKARAAAFDAAAVANNDLVKKLDDRAEDQLDKVDAWKKECANKKFDQNDEIVINKERAKAAAAASAASAAAASAASAAGK